MPHGPVNKVFDLTPDRHLVALFLEHAFIKRDVIGDEAQVEGEIGVLELIAVALFVELVGGFFGVALDNCVEVFEALFLVGTKFGVVESGGVLSFEQLFPGFAPFGGVSVGLWIFMIVVLIVIINGPVFRIVDFLNEFVLIFLIIPNTLRPKDGLLFHSFLAKVTLINFNRVDKASRSLKRVE